MRLIMLIYLHIIRKICGGPSLVNNRNYMLELTPLTQKTCLYIVNHQKAKNDSVPGRNHIINDFRIISTFLHK